MSKSCVHTNPLSREGTNQVQRLLEKLIPENVKLHELTEENWLSFAREYATLINFYDLHDAQNPSGDWEQFFPETDEVESSLSQYFSGNVQPHLALFIAFLKLLSYPQKSLNGIPKRHLDFYYKEVLRLQPREFEPDTVHILYELAKNAVAELIPKNSLLEAGKDAEGNLLNYKTTDDFVATQTKVGGLKAFYLRNNQLLYANNPQTKDGLEEELEEGENWSAFGSNTWPNSPLELAIAGRIFSLQEGNRAITLTWDFDKQFQVSGNVFASLTTEDGWTEEVSVTISGAKNHIWTLELNEEEKPITSFNKEIHLLHLNTSEPMLKLRLEDPDIYAPASSIRVIGLEVDVEVSGITQLHIENELGTQLPDKPFMPFGPRPKKKSKLSLFYPEFAGKEIKSFSLYFNWLNTPPNFSNHYEHYQEAIQAEKNEQNNNLGYVMMYELAFSSFLNSEASNQSASLVFKDFEVEPDPMRDEFKFTVSSPYQSGEKEVKMFTTLPQVEIETDNDYVKGGEIELRLKESFYHHLYNNVYVSVVSQSVFTGVEPEDLPKEPYTPLVDSVSLDYSATTSVSFGDNEVSGTTLSFFHLTPFGSKLVNRRSSLIYPVESNTLFIGLVDAKARDVVSVLFQVNEGSENPLLSNFSENEAISWDILTANDEWHALGENEILLNTTNNFLRSGIIRFSLPESTSTNHNLFASNWVWLRARLKKPPQAISRFLGVHAQASTAEFENQNNVIDHLNKGLASGSIKQLAERKSKIKKVLQPYASFGGKATEADDDFYIRTSERLRHKDRAITIWDYERMTLQAFPNLYKVRCLNHTRVQNQSIDELCPGYITLVVLPKISDNSDEYQLYPTVSQNVKDEVKEHLLSKKIMHAELEVVNPQYELVEFDLKVRFHPNYNYNFYRGVLEKDLIAMLAPWAYDSAAEISFNNTVYSYSVVNFIENLEYVDYLEDFKMNHYVPSIGWQPKKSIRPSSSMGILAPKSSHKISEAQKC